MHYMYLIIDTMVGTIIDTIISTIIGTIINAIIDGMLGISVEAIALTDTLRLCKRHYM